MKNWRETFLCNKLLSINEDLAYKKTVNCTSVVDLKTIRKYLYRIRCKEENNISKIGLYFFLPSSNLFTIHYCCIIK